MRVPAEERCWTQENSLKNLEQIVTVVYPHFILFRMHELSYSYRGETWYFDTDGSGARPAQRSKETC